MIKYFNEDIDNEERYIQLSLQEMPEEDFEQLEEGLISLEFSKLVIPERPNVKAYFHQDGILVLNKGSFTECYCTKFDFATNQPYHMVIDSTYSLNVDGFINHVMHYFCYDLMPLEIQEDECTIPEFKEVINEMAQTANSTAKVKYLSKTN